MSVASNGEDGTRVALRDPCENRCLAERLQQDEAHGPALRLLVARHQLNPAVKHQAWRVGGQSRALEQSYYPFAFHRRKARRTLRQCGREHYPRSHRLTMQPRAITRRRFDRMREGVSEVEQRAFTGFALVSGDNLGLMRQLSYTACAIASVSRLGRYRESRRT